MKQKEPHNETGVREHVPVVRVDLSVDRISLLRDRRRETCSSLSLLLLFLSLLLLDIHISARE